MKWKRPWWEDHGAWPIGLLRPCYPLDVECTPKAYVLCCQPVRAGEIFTRWVLGEGK
ncbi:hypothetical protein LEMLEM_LOCUS1910 [Lemmus lemmus]